MNEVKENYIPQYLKENSDMGKWLYVSDVMEFLQVSKPTIYKHIRNEKFRSIKVRNRRLIETASLFGYLIKEKIIQPREVEGIELKKQIIYSLRGDKSKIKKKSL